MLSMLNPFQLMEEIRMRGDPRTRDFPVAGNPFFVFTLTLTYLYFVYVAGPRWMKYRKPFEIINLVRVYNLTMVYLNARFFWLFVSHCYLPGGKYNLFCQGISKTVDPADYELYWQGSWYVLVRYADYLDTVFFIMRKKFNQVTRLHVIHHTTVTCSAWFYFLFAPEGQPALGLCMNAFVHVVMYTYYFLSTFGPEVKKYLWWKIYLTRLQILQFVIFIGHMSIPLFVDCGFPKSLCLVPIANTVVILMLFIDYYYRAYINLMKRMYFKK
ncbi:very long chain fatty acid elongase AAEL008004-like [Ornithodoros turicata]|uniref:very long chain fatty acid elongase AAEL008004-like n=1 Tax=Ornithodoros turicata TaxID=34597 RepID=UPI003139D98E